MRTTQTHLRPITARLGSLLTAALLLALAALPAAAQDVPTDGLLLRLQDGALETSTELSALEAELDWPMPYTAAAIHPHNGRWSVTISQGTLEEGVSPSRFLSDEAAEFFFYDRMLDADERDVLRDYVAMGYNAPDAEGSDGFDQGIHVQGSWSIEVRNPDGSLVERRDFNNQFVGEDILPLLITGDLTPGNYTVGIDGDPSPCVVNGNNVRCLAEEGESLVVSVPSSGDNADSIVLSGNTTVDNGSDITQVSANVGDCTPDVAPADCLTGNLRPLTEKTLQSDPPIHVASGQQVNIEVVISFN